ncbi:MAG: M15 family metallopeptidase [Nitratireductor sp.]|nr:M15 family metallopeptidase [Nitratireductor sp.]MCB1455329.1 M15 family metallopeptidase [Nitratireductor sp.]
MKTIALAFAAITLLVQTGACKAGDLPAGFVRLASVAPDIVQDMRYAGANNFTGSVVPGYQAGECILAAPVARALSRVQQDMVRQGRTLVVLDCYRPRRAVESFVRWAKRQGERLDPTYHPRIAGSRLVAEGYIGARSGHSSGGSVDLVFASRDANGKPVWADMGGGFDLFDPLSHSASRAVSKTAQDNRRFLISLMARHGFSNYRREWWHFRFDAEPHAGQSFDFPVTAAD